MFWLPHLWTKCPEVLYFFFWTFCPKISWYNTDNLYYDTDYFENQHNTANQTTCNTVQSQNTSASTDTEITAYLDIAEVHALNKEPMYMKDWLETIDDYLKMTRRDILTSSGRISHKQAIEKAHAEYDKYKNRLDDTLSPVEKDFIESIGMLEQITDSSKK